MKDLKKDTFYICIEGRQGEYEVEIQHALSPQEIEKIIAHANDLFFRGINES